MTVKESYNVAGLPTTWGMPAYADYLPGEDAVQVSRLKAALWVALSPSFFGRPAVPKRLALLDTAGHTFLGVAITSGAPLLCGRAPQRVAVNLLLSQRDVRYASIDRLSWWPWSWARSNRNMTGADWK
jgi:hypothetical protein